MISALIGMMTLCTVVAAAQTGVSPPVPDSSSRPEQTSSTSLSSSPSASPTPPRMPRVVKVIEGHLELDDIIRVEVDSLSEWAAENDPSKLVPYLNGRAIRGNYPEEIHVSENHLQFHLQIIPENKNTWVDLLGEPTAYSFHAAVFIDDKDEMNTRQLYLS